jgi:DNA-binding CsgD family transcriptional regulator
METIVIPPLSPYDFIEKIKTPKMVEISRYLDFYKSTIKNFNELSIAPHFWIIPDNFLGKIVFVSDNCRELTPYTVEEWLNPEDPAMHFASLMHPEDRDFIFSASQFSMEVAQQFRLLGKTIKSSIYARFLNAQNEYRWMLVQVPKFYFDEEGVCQSLISFFTDLSHLSPQNKPIMTVMSSNNEGEQFFQVIPSSRKLISLTVPKLTKRQKQILKFMASGLSTPQIAEALKITYSTVQNHKRILREKTNTKSAAELMNYVIRHQLI